MHDLAISCFFAAVTGLILSGCGEANQPDATEAYPVEGKVAFEDGDPVAGVLVSFSSLDGAANASAVTDDNGHYHIEGEGLPAGDYRVAVGPAPREDGTMSPRTVDPKYSNKATSGFTATIKPPDNFYNIEVERSGEMPDNPR